MQASRKKDKTVITKILADDWEGYTLGREEAILTPIDTTFALKNLDKLADGITKLPADKKFMRKIERIIADRNKQYTRA